METVTKSRLPVNTKRQGNMRLKRLLARGGWSRRTAAEFLGVHFTYLSLVLNGHRESRRLCRRIEEMPPLRKLAAKVTGGGK